MIARACRRGSATTPFTLVDSSVTPPPGVNSPADNVVGIAICRISPPLPDVVAALAKSIVREPARPPINCHAAFFTVSIGLPPPKLTMQSVPARRYSSTSATTVCEGTCWLAPLNTPARREPAAAVTLSSSFERPSVLPVTISARLSPLRSSSCPRPAALPGPKVTFSRRVKLNSPATGSIGSLPRTVLRLYS